VAVAAALLTLLFFPLRRTAKVTMPRAAASATGGVIEVEASEVPSDSRRRLRNP
jgi:hypothetical protein